MRIESPVLVESLRNTDDDFGPGGRIFRVRPLFFDEPEQTNRNYDEVISNLTGKIYEILKQLSREGHYETMLRWTFSPEATLKNFEFMLDHSGRFVRIKVPIVYYPCGDHFIAFCPIVDVPRFDAVSPEDIQLRGKDVFREYFRTWKKEQGADAEERLLERINRRGQFRLTNIDCFLESSPPSKRNESVGTKRNRDISEQGRHELNNVGTCLDKLYPRNLDKAVGRDGLTERIYNVLTNPQRNAVLLVGPPKVGKTAIIHSVVARMVETIKRPEHDPKRFAVWQLLPGRLISGMSNAGEWETRLNSIFAYAESNELTLNFAQPIALLNTGKSQQGNLAMSDLLLNALRKRRFRTIAEMTEEQLRVFRERNRSLADQFEIIYVAETPRDETLRIMLNAARDFEWKWGCTFDVDLIPLVFDMTKQFENDAAMPGKAVHWLGALAMQRQNETISRNDFIEMFREKTGLRLSFFDTESKATKKIDTPEEIETVFRSRIVGQHEAVAVMRDVAVYAESLLSDPGRPIASLFFLGPTGVGKTECAKQLARYFFGSEDRLLRFDANELCTSSAVARLVGSHQNVEGLLTGAIRRQPFSVVLFDEIEKGHPDLYDLLLQVIGEARLTDTQGRVASFSQSIIVFTSNLGTREAASKIGFGSSGSGTHTVKRDSGYIKAIQDFFRPEFVNRIDRIIPFDFLSRKELEELAERMLDEITAREGLSRRHGRLLITSQAKRRLLSGEIDLVFGARGMRRVLERELVAPVGRFLAANSSRNPAVVEVSTSTSKSGLAIRCFDLIQADAQPVPSWYDREILHTLHKSKRKKLLETTKLSLATMYDKVSALRPKSRFNTSKSNGFGFNERLYFRLVEEHTELRREIDMLLELEEPKRERLPSATKLTRPEFSMYPVQTFLKQLQADIDLKKSLDELFANRSVDKSKELLPRFFMRIGRFFEAVEATQKPIEHVTLLQLESGNVSPPVPFEGDSLPGEVWQAKRIEIPFTDEVAGVDNSSGKISLEAVQCSGAFSLLERQQGTILAFDGDVMSIRSLQVFKYSGNEKELVEAIRMRLSNPAEKWAPITQIARWNNRVIQTINVCENYFKMPKEIRDVFET